LSEDLTRSPYAGPALSWRMQAAPRCAAAIGGRGVFLLLRDPKSNRRGFRDLQQANAASASITRPSRRNGATLKIEPVEQQASAPQQ